LLGADGEWTASLFDRSPIGQAIVDPSGRFLRVNAALASMLGRPPAELVGLTTAEVTHPDDRALTTELAGQLLAGELDHYGVEKRYLRPDGSVVWGRLTVAGVRDAEGEVSFLVSHVEDVTAQHAAEDELARSERRHRAIIERASDLLVLIDDLGYISYASGAATRLLGLDPEEVVGSFCLDYVHPDDVDRVGVELLSAIAQTGIGVPTPMRLVDVHGAAVPVEALATNLRDDEAVGAVLVTIRDVRERKELDRRFRSAFDAAPIGISVVSLDGEFLDVNTALARLLGYDPVVLCSMRFQDITHPDDVGVDLEHLARLVGGEISDYRTDKRYIRADGSVIWIELSVTVVYDDDGRPAFFISLIEDITDRRAHAEGLAHQARHDHLTGLLNRRATIRHLDAALARHHTNGLAVLFADLDGFKGVNDTHGHVVGDEVLRTVAERVLESLRPGDLAGRFGGDEFIVVLEDADEQQAAAVAARLCRLVAEPVAVGGGAVQVCASVGIAVAKLGEDAGALLARADEAMYAEKRRRSATRPN
jgi:diguanylate cyclase (GGDEF)-like protein/PAS domain S-box-containing protein